VDADARENSTHSPVFVEIAMGPAMEENMRVITPNGAMTVDRAEETRQELLSALNAVDRVIVNLSHVSEVDLSFIQILIAAEKEARASGKQFRLSGEVAEPVRGAFLTGGFCKSECTTGQELEEEAFQRVRQAE
jgi:anti-anti-sigma regulatory factor